MKKRNKTKFSLHNIFFKKYKKFKLKNLVTKNFEGLSTVIVGLLLILLSLFSIGVFWVVVNNIIEGGTEEVALGRFTLNAQIKNVMIDTSSNNVSFSVKRNTGEGTLTGMKFVFSDGTKIEEVTQNFPLTELQERNFEFHLTNINASNLSSVAIYPVIKTDGEVIIGNVLDDYTIQEEDKETIPSECAPATCLSLGHNCGNWSDGCGGIIDCAICSGGQTCVDGTCESTTSLCSNLKLLYHLDRNLSAGENDTYVYDWSGEGNNATVTGAKFNASGKIDGAYEFRGAQQIRSIPRHNYSLTTFAVSFWAKCIYQQPQYPKLFMAYRNSTGYNGVYVYFYPSNGNDSYVYTWFLNSTGMVPVGLSGQVRSTRPFCNDSLWHNLIYQYNGSQAQLYIDFSLNRSYNIQSPITNVTFFQLSYNNPSSNFNGTIDEVAFWDKSLNSSEISELGVLGNSGQRLTC